MPIYEYVCNDCSHEYESLQKFTDPPEKVCPNCKGRVERQLSQSAFHLRGGGWYNDGYGGKESGKSAKSGNGTDSKSSGGGDSASKSSGGDSKSSGGGDSKSSSSGDSPSKPSAGDSGSSGATASP